MTIRDADPTQVFFQLTHRPFTAIPRVDRYFPGAAIDSARELLLGAIRRGAGPGLIVGGPGTGKTLLLHVLADSLRDSCQVALLGTTSLCTRRALLQWLLFELGLPYRQLSEGELRLALIDHLRSPRLPHGGLALFVDEAHAMPLKLLEEIRMMSNQAHGGLPRVHVVLAGTERLDERLALPDLDGFQQRLASRCYLAPLGRDETFRYIQHCVRWAGGDSRNTFDHAAVQAVYDATGGVPRRINQVCDYALVLASAAGRRPLDAEVIQEAWSDLQQLPVPSLYASATQESGASTWIEFGSLDEADSEVALSVPTRSVPTSANVPPAESTWEPDERAIEGRLNDITQQVASLADDETTAAVQLDDPFAEPFAEEELIVDRYATMITASRSPRDARPILPAGPTSSSAHREVTESVPPAWSESPPLEAPLAAERYCREFVAELAESIEPAANHNTHLGYASEVPDTAADGAATTTLATSTGTRGLFRRLRSQADGSGA